jgi:hypothetical protein
MGSRKSRHTDHRNLDACAASAAVHADARCAQRRSLGLCPFIDAAPGCPVTRGGGHEAQGVWMR